MSDQHRGGDGSAWLAIGLPLGLVFGALAIIRRAKPLHPTGRLRPGVLEIAASDESTGVPLLDTPDRHTCVVRTSRAIGLPTSLPDIHGLAIRLELQGVPADLLLAGTGHGRWGRHLLIPRRDAGRGPMKTLVPAGTPLGPLVLGLFPEHGADESDPAVSA